MDKLKRLRWVPMLIKAYYEAQNRVQTSTPTQLVKPDAQTEAPAKSDTANETPRVHQKLRRPTSQPRRSARRNQRLPQDKTTRLLQELRAANRKLESLESIQLKLQQLGSVMDDFNQQITRIQAARDVVAVGNEDERRPLTEPPTVHPSF